MIRREQAALLTVLRHSGRPWPEVSQRVECAGSAVSLVDHLVLPPRPSLNDIDRDLAAAIDAAEHEIAQWEAEGIGLVSVLDDAYPVQLLTVHDHPPFLTYRGTLDRRDDRGVAVVGTRQASEAGSRLAAEVAVALVGSDRPVVSGLAAGIDSAAHRAALNAGGRTIAVIGTGVRRVYPAAHRALQTEIGERGLVLSQFWPDSPPARQSFPMRNVVMSGYSFATVVVEASHTSGARMQAGFALRHGRPVIVMASLLVHDWAREIAALPGVTVADSPGGVLDAVNDLARIDAELVWAEQCSRQFAASPIRTATFSTRVVELTRGRPERAGPASSQTPLTTVSTAGPDVPGPAATACRGELNGEPAQRSTSPRMNRSTASRASSSRYCSGGDFMK
jgi:DNA processing protein